MCLRSHSGEFCVIAESTGVVEILGERSRCPTLFSFDCSAPKDAFHDVAVILASTVKKQSTFVPSYEPQNQCDYCIYCTDSKTE